MLETVHVDDWHSKIPNVCQTRSFHDKQGANANFGLGHKLPYQRFLHCAAMLGDDSVFTAGGYDGSNGQEGLTDLLYKDINVLAELSLVSKVRSDVCEVIYLDLGMPEGCMQRWHRCVVSLVLVSAIHWSHCGHVYMTCHTL
jgi:hypothetical protein